MVSDLVSPHGPWVFQFHVFILSVGFIFKLFLQGGWTSSQCHMRTQEQSVASPQKRGKFPRHTPNTLPLIDQNWVTCQLLTQLLIRGMRLLSLAYKNYLRFNGCWDLYHPIYDRVLFLKSAIENCRKGFVLTCLGSYCLPLRPIPMVSKMGELSLLSLNEVVTPRSIALVYEWYKFWEWREHEENVLPPKKCTPIVSTTTFKRS